MSLEDKQKLADAVVTIRRHGYEALLRGDVEAAFQAHSTVVARVLKDALDELFGKEDEG